MKISIKRRSAFGHTSPRLEDTLDDIKKIFEDGRAYSRRQVAKKLSMDYCYTTTLIKILTERGEKLNLLDVYHLKGSREEREEMIRSGDYSISEMARKLKVKRQAIHGYMVKHGMHDDWAKKRANK
jgi:hypothetical protein